MSYTIIHKGTSISTFGKKVENNMLKFMTDLVEVGKVEAQRVYLEKRKTDVMPSYVLSSFVTYVGFGSGKSIVGYVQCGGSMAPHARYLEYDRKLRNGVAWSSVNPDAPYGFMQAGLDKMKSVVPKGLKIIFEKV